MRAGRGNRSFEYNAMTDDYVRFLIDELLPYIARTHKLNLSTDGNDRSIAGTSSGGNLRFTAAWERPDAFRRVFSNVGSFGRTAAATSIRSWSASSSPSRSASLQDGSNDLRFAYGDWWAANQEIEQALSFAGYEVAHSWDKGGHEMTYATKVFPEAMRWLWKDWPKPIRAGAGSPYLQQVVLPGETWQPLAAGRYRDATSPTANAKGEVFFCDAPADKIYKVEPGRGVRVFLTNCGHASGLACGPNGRLYAAAGDQIVAYDADHAGTGARSPRVSMLIAWPSLPTATFT